MSASKLPQITIGVSTNGPTTRVNATVKTSDTTSPNTAEVSGIDTATLTPALRTSFRRSTLYLPESRSRVTIDTDLMFCTPAGTPEGETLAFPELAILETKTTGLPSSLDRLLWSLGIRPLRFSKFGTGLAELHPELPHTKWARVMRTRLVAT